MIRNAQKKAIWSKMEDRVLYASAVDSPACTEKPSVPDLYYWPQLFKKWITLYSLHTAIGFAVTYPLDSDLSGGWHYLSIEQVGPGDTNATYNEQENGNNPLLSLSINVHW